MKTPPMVEFIIGQGFFIVVSFVAVGLIELLNRYTRWKTRRELRELGRKSLAEAEERAKRSAKDT